MRMHQRRIRRPRRARDPISNAVAQLIRSTGVRSPIASRPRNAEIEHRDGSHRQYSSIAAVGPQSAPLAPFRPSILKRAGFTTASRQLAERMHGKGVIGNREARLPWPAHR